MPAAGTVSANGVRRQRFRVLDFENTSGTRSYRVQGMTRGKVYVRENYASEREAQCRRTQLENEYLLGDDTPLRQPRMTMMTEDQVHLAEQIFRQMSKAEVPDCDLSTAVSAWIKAGRQKDAGTAPRLDEALEQFEKWLAETPTLRPRTKENYSYRTRRFVDSMENFRLDAIAPEMVEAYLASKTAATSRRADQKVLAAFFRWAGERPRRWITTNPAAAVVVELGTRPEPAILTVDQCEALLRAAEAHRGGRVVPYIALCLFAGIRPSEAQRLNWSKINFADKEIRLSADDTKTGRARMVPMDATLVAWLKPYQGGIIANQMTTKSVRKIREAAGITVWPPDVMRHTSVSHHFRRSGSYGRTAEFHGNSESIIKAHYQGRVSTAETKAFYSLKPTKKG